MSNETPSKISPDAFRQSEKAIPSSENKTHANTEEFAFTVPFGDMGDINGNVFEAYVRTSQAILENAAALNQEMVRFAGERFRADLEAMQTLPGYTNVQGVVSFQSEFMRRAAEAYQAEFTKLMQQNSDAMSTIFEPLIETVKSNGKEDIRK